MPGPDVHVFKSRTEDRSRGNPPGRSKDALAGPAVRVLSLQRTLGNRATAALLRARQPAARILQRQLRGKSGVVSGKTPLDEPTGRRILEEFARNDPRSVGDLFRMPKRLAPEKQGSRWRLEDQEWGLISENLTNEVHLILGDKNGVQWEDYLDEGTPLAHSHPWQDGTRTIKGPWDLLNVGSGSEEPLEIKPVEFKLDDLLTQEGDPAIRARMMVLPTVSDFAFPARQGQDKHTVFTPYVIDDAGVIRDPGPQDAQTRRLTWELTEISLDEANQMTGRLTAATGGRAVRSYRVQAPAETASQLKKTRYTVFG